MSAEGDKAVVTVEGRSLTLTNLGKVLYPETGFTKAQVIDYYSRIAPVMLPHLAGRPLTLARYPDGVTGKHFFAKHAPGHRPGWVPTAWVPSQGYGSRDAGPSRPGSPGSAPPGAGFQRSAPPGAGQHAARAHGDGHPVLYLVGGDLPVLIWVANLAALEIHTPMWRLPRPGEPDLIMFDLDPGPPATVVECCEVAVLLRSLLEGAGLCPLVKTSGGKGLQLAAPVSGVTSDVASGLAHAIAEQLERDHRDLVVSRMTRSLRRGKVLIDWSQNSAAKTTISPYSLRAMWRPTVSTPVSWDEVSDCRDPEDLVFTSDDVLTRVEARGDLLAPLLTGWENDGRGKGNGGRHGRVTRTAGRRRR